MSVRPLSVAPTLKKAAENGAYLAVTEAPLTPASTATADVQAAITTAARAANGQVYLHAPVTLSGGEELTIPGPVHIRGANRPDMTITQTVAGKRGFVLQQDTANGETFTRGVIIEGLKLIGAGATTGGDGIQGTAADTSIYQGQHLTLRNVTLRNWDQCIRLHRWDNIEARQLAVEFSRVGWYSDGNANSVHVQISATNCTETATRFGDGSGVVLDALDLISCGMMVDALDQSRVVILGGNFESCTGSQAFVHVNNGAGVIAFPGRFIKNVGNDVPGFLVENGGVLEMRSLPFWSGFTTNQLIRKASTSATVYGPPPSRNLSVAAEALIDEGGLDSYPATPFVTRQENSIPAASANLRAMLLWGMVRNATNTGNDDLFAYIRDRNGGTSTYSRRTLTRTITGTGTPEGSVAAGPGTLYLDNSGSVMTLYVKAFGSGTTGWVSGGGYRGLRTITASTTGNSQDEVILCNGASVTYTLPSAASVGAGNLKTVKNINAASATVATSSAQTIDGATSDTLAQNGVGRYISDGTNWQKV